MIILTSSYFPNIISGISTPAKKEYCKQHHYLYKIEEKSVQYKERWERKHHKVFGFYRIEYLKKLCDQYDDNNWLVWTDFDAFVMNPNIKLEFFTDYKYELIIGEDWNGINSGVFFLKINSNTKKFLIDVLNFKPNKKQSKYPDWWVKSEQCALHFLHHKIKTKIVHHKLFNTYPYGPEPCNDWRHMGLGPSKKNWKPHIYQDGDFILHLCSGDIQFKMNHLRKYIAC
jgi:hypothetical protein